MVKGWGLPLHEPGVELLAAKLGLAAREGMLGVALAPGLAKEPGLIPG